MRPLYRLPDGNFVNPQYVVSVWVDTVLDWAHPDQWGVRIQLIAGHSSWFGCASEQEAETLRDKLAKELS